MISLAKIPSMFFVSLFLVAISAQPLIAIPLQIHTKQTTHILDVEIAKTDSQRKNGLMFRKSIAPNKGMLFLYDVPQKICFWMKNTYVPLDVILINKQNHIVQIIKKMIPHSLQSRCAKSPVVAAVEIKAGQADTLGLKPGDRVTWSIKHAAH